MKPADRPFVAGAYATADLPDTPQRDYRIAPASWIEAPRSLIELGDGIGEPVEYKRRIGRYLLWRAGPPVGTARYMAISDDLSEVYRFDLDGRQGSGHGPDGATHTRFRSWKESLRDAESPHVA